MKIYQSAQELIGNTPLLRLKKIEEYFGVNAVLLAKLEAFNPAGSVKDRAAKSMLDDAEARGLINENSVIIEPTSGNTGIGLCSVAATRGYKTVIVMPENMSVERKLLMKAYGAEVVLTPASKGMAGAIEKANELASSIKGAFIPAQFENPANPEAHYRSTGPEIYRDTEGELDFFVAGVGTGGTISGVGRYLKENKPSVKVVAVEPASSPVLSEGKSGAHGIQGIGAGFIPKALDVAVYDEIVTVTEENAYQTARLTGVKEGVLVGISSGAALWATVQLARKKENEGKTFVVLFPDGGDKYLSTPLYANL